MMATEPICCESFTNAQDAHIARSILEANGIVGVVVGDQLSTTLAWFGHPVKRVDLMVDRQWADEAAGILREQRLDNRTLPLGDSEPTVNWRCTACHEVNATTFDHCWSCGTDRPDDAAVVDRASPGPTAVPVWDRNVGRSTKNAANNPVTDESPYRVPQQHNSYPDRVDDDENSLRALRAAFLGLVFPVPLSFYGLYLSLRSVVRGTMTGRTWLALAFSLPWVLTLTILLLAWLTEMVRMF